LLIRIRIRNPALNTKSLNFNNLLFVQHLKWGNPDFWAFMACRAMVGIGEASYSTIAPTIISDMFVKDMRSKMLALFYFAIPVGRCVHTQHQLKGLCHEVPVPYFEF
jgi:hypothetical protein